MHHNDNAAESLAEAFVESAAIHDTAYEAEAREARGRIYQLAAESTATMTHEVIALIDRGEAMLRSSVRALLACKAENTMLRRKLELSTKSEKWLRSRQTAQTTKSASEASL
jgi:hypothetical protein